MSESNSDYERLRRAERELGGRGDDVVEPIEESEEVAEAVEDDTALTAEALGVYSADGQVDDATGGDAGAEEAYGHEARPDTDDARGTRWSPEGRTGPA